MSIHRKRMGQGLASTLVAVALHATIPANAQEKTATIIDALANGTSIVELRPRYEHVEQDGRPNDGEAATLRTRLGWQTTKWNGLQALIEIEDVRGLGPKNYDTNLNGKAAYAQIFDPETTELNRLQLIWSPDPALTATLGRQRINLDDQRFIGGSAWRQDEQTFDAARIDTRHGQLDATYIYISRINRILAEDQDWNSKSHVLSASYAFAESLKLTGFAYALDFNRPTTPGVRNQSSLTWGAKASGKVQWDSVRFDYAATAARQRDYGSSLLDYELGFLSAEATVTHGPLSARLAYDQLEGNGVRGFSTPLGSLHAFNGWSDAFISNGAKTTVDGLRDANVTLAWNTGVKWDYLSNLTVTARYHAFDADRTGADLGSERDLMVSGTVTPQLSWLVKFADYDGSASPLAPADRSKIWLGFEWKM
jgi:hypothetical protein